MAGRRVDDHRWPERAGKPRVLVEDHQGVTGQTGAFLVESGYDVVVCRGPDVRHESCALLTNGTCGLVAGADVVYSRLSWSHKSCQRLLDVLGSRYPRTAVVIELPHGEQWPAARALDRRELVFGKSDPEIVASTIARALNSAVDAAQT